MTNQFSIDYGYTTKKSQVKISLFKKKDNGRTNDSFENIKIYNDYLKTLSNQNACIYLKIHPREDSNKYLNLCKKYNLTFLDGFPLELLELFDINFSLGVTYNSTANYLNCFDAMKFLDKTIEAKN